MIPAVIERCVGIDVGKKTVWACVMVGAANATAEAETRAYGTTVESLEQLRDWVVQQGCTHALMESTGAYWKPVFNILEASLEVLLANPHEVKARKGHKTDKKDAWWLAHLLRHGIFTPSFIPPRAQRELRDLTRRRKKLIGAATAEKNRVDKILQDANVKLSSVLSDIFGVSGQLMVNALLQGDMEAARIAEFARGTARKKIPEIEAALRQHRMTDHHRMMIRLAVEHLCFLSEQVVAIEEQIKKLVEESGWEKQWRLLQTVPGLQEPTAATVLAEMGPEVGQFADEKHVSSWAGLCPGNNRSAGKNLGSHTQRGNRWLKAALTEAAWGVSKSKDCHLRHKFWRIAAKSKPKAIVAIAHDLLVLSYLVLRRGTPYVEKPGAVMTEPQKQRLIRHHVRRLGRLGIAIRVSPILGPERPKCRREPKTKSVNP